MSEKIKIICVVGPTACGKTGLGVDLAKKYGGEVISADSMQIYKDMHIASAAPDQAQTKGVPHHLVEFLPYGSEYTVYDWVQAAREKIYDIASRGRLPIIVGGTGLYINTLVDNLELMKASNNTDCRKRLEETAQNEGIEVLFEKLRKIDPTAAQKLHLNDKKRIIRALEIYETTGLTPTEHNARSRENESPFDATVICIFYKERQKLYDRINRRVDLMVESGLEAEAKRAYLLKGADKGGAVQAIGHKELFDFFDGKISFAEAIENLKRATRRYAKRQITWFGARQDLNIIYADQTDDLLGAATEIIESKGGNAF